MRIGRLSGRPFLFLLWRASSASPDFIDCHFAGIAKRSQVIRHFGQSGLNFSNSDLGNEVVNSAGDCDEIIS